MDGYLNISNNNNKNNVRRSIGVALNSFDFKSDRPRCNILTHQQDGSPILIKNRSQQQLQQRRVPSFSSDEFISSSNSSKWSDFRNFVGSIESSQNDR